ncbi:ATP-binding cassette domain-containing protein [Nonomuraea sp. NPDC051941]|uniref:ATP-binding cassette domain-containing protein n=1 Tax=Nonomuraea sp. NPDC051941 TaxID=3364373 RepID=UPI0037CB9C46
MALVGDHGSGKTTLVKLLCGFYRPTGGTITVDGTPLAELDPAAWRDRVTRAGRSGSARPSATASSCPAASGRRSPCHGRSCGRRHCSTSRRPRWTRPARTRSTSGTRRRPRSLQASAYQ